MFRAGLHAVFHSFVPDLSLHHTDCRYSCGVHGITDGIFVIATVFLLLQMERETQSGRTGPRYAVPRAVADPSGVRFMERRPNSEPDTPCPPPLIRCVDPGDLPPASMERGLSRTYRMMKCWDGPQYPAFNRYEDRRRSFLKTSWPHTNLSPSSFAAAGFFYTGTDLCISLPYNVSTQYPFYISLYHIITGNADETRCFHCGGGFHGKEWDKDEPRLEHLKYFPSCVYVQIVIDEKEKTDASKDTDDSNVLRNCCTIL